MKRRNKNYFRWVKALLCTGLVALPAFLLPVQAEDVQCGSLFFTLPEEFSYQQDSGLILKNGEQVGRVAAYPLPEDINDGIAWQQALDFPEWQDESLGYFGDNTSLEFFSDVPPEQERTVLTLHSFFWDDRTLYDLCLDELKLDDAQQRAILASAAVGERKTPLPYAFDDLPEGYAVIEEEDGVKITDGSRIVGGVTAYPIPEGVYDPYDEWFTWLEDVGIPDYSDKTLMLDGSISDFQGGWYAYFRGLPEGDELPPIKRSHHFTVQDKVVYDAWVDAEALGESMARTLSQAMRYVSTARHKTVTAYPEGQETVCETEEVTRPGYSIFLPAEDWVFSGLEISDGIPTDILQYGLNDAIELRIVTLAGKDLPAAQRWVRASWPQYDLIEDKRGGLGGTDAQQNMLDAALYPAENVTYAVIRRYPLEAAEGGGMWLNVFADTFTLNEETAMTQEEADFLQCMAVVGRVGFGAASPYWLSSGQTRDGKTVSVSYLEEGNTAMLIQETNENGFRREALLSTEDGLYCNAGAEENSQALLWHPCQEEHALLMPLMTTVSWNRHYTHYLGRSADETGETISYQLLAWDDDGNSIVQGTVDFRFDADGSFNSAQWQDFRDADGASLSATESFISLDADVIHGELAEACRQAEG